MPMDSVENVPSLGSPSEDTVFDRLALDDLVVLIAEDQQPRHEAGVGVDVRDLLVGVGVALAHEATTEQAHADLLAPVRSYLLDGHGLAPPSV